ncbi:hypothetical protein AN641_00695 [Candidatus Epulonipiscioides gigas]|nr:hypothetical protein AN641_00695 [Epulopiscium sp. SCG-C07WGA-EpuloA2]
MKKTKFIIALMSIVSISTSLMATENIDIVSGERIEVAMNVAPEKTGREIHVYSKEIPWNVYAIKTNDTISTIADALNQAVEGDTIVLHEGIYREVLNVKKDNITIKANEGDYVLISGNEIVSNFVPEPTMSGVFVTDVAPNYKETNLQFTQVFVNGNYAEIARFPDKTIDDYMMPIEDGSGYSKTVNISKGQGIVDGKVTFDEGKLPNVDLTGAQFRGLNGKNAEYVFGNVTSSKGNTITFKPSSNNNWTKAAEIKEGYHDFGFGFVMHKNLLDHPGEWFVEDGKIYYMPENGTMDGLQVEMQVRQKVLVLNNTTGVTIDNINFVAGNGDINNVDGATINNCTFRYLQPFYTTKGYGINDNRYSGIYGENVTNTAFTNTYLGRTWGTGVTIYKGDNNSFINCIFEDIGWIGTFTAGVYSSADNTLIQDCSFKDQGRFQVRVDKDIKIDILHSSFERAMKMGEDAGPLEFTSTGKIAPLDLGGSEIAYNKVFDLHGVPVSSGSYNKQFVVAFYMEDVNNYTAHHNLVYDITANSYDGPEKLIRDGRFLYLGPRYNAMNEPVNYYNNTVSDTDTTIGIWNIQIGNFEELKAGGLQQEEHTGVMTDGHFVNNIFSEGEFSINYSAQNLTPTGASKGWADIPDNKWKSIKTNDMDEFFEHSAKVDYFFYPETNIVIEDGDEKQNYIDPENGDFNLKSSSDAKGEGTHIEGITSSANPDLGALEGSDYVLSAGATLQIREFKEVR